MNTYPAYRDSGVEWLGEIPSHWELPQAHYISRVVRGQTPRPAGDPRFFDGNFIPWITVGEATKDSRMYLTETTAMLTEEGSQHSLIFEKGTLIFTNSGATLGVPKILGITGCMNDGVAAFLDIRSDMSKEFLYFFLLSMTKILRDTSKISGQPNLNTTIISGIQIPKPTLEEQKAIANFLDRKTAQIDTLIEKKQRELELLREMRDVMTQNAMRSSKAKNLKLGDVADWIKRPMNRQDEEEYERIGLYNRGRGIFHKPITKGKDLGDSDFFEIKDGDFVISGQFAWEGAVALAQPEEDGCFASHRYYSLRGKPNKAETAYLFSFFTTQLGDNLLNHHSRGAAGRNRPLNINTLLREKIPVPPVSLQEPITALIEKEVVLKKNTQLLVEFLREYRTALISEAVTGKIDVR